MLGYDCRHAQHVGIVRALTMPTSTRHAVHGAQHDCNNNNHEMTFWDRLFLVSSLNSLANIESGFLCRHFRNFVFSCSKSDFASANFSWSTPDTSFILAVCALALATALAAELEPPEDEGLDPLALAFAFAFDFGSLSSSKPTPMASGT